MLDGLKDLQLRESENGPNIIKNFGSLTSSQ